MDGKNKIKGKTLQGHGENRYSEISNICTKIGEIPSKSI